MIQELVSVRTGTRSVQWGSATRCVLAGLWAVLFTISAAAESAEQAPDAPAAPAAAKSKPLPPLSELLERESEDPDTYTERCLVTRNIRTHRVLDAQHLLFEMRGGELYLVQFPRRCFGLRRGDPISYRTSSGRLCKLDDIRPLEYRGRGLEAGVPCYIPGFQQVTADQVEYLKEALKAQRRNR